MDLVIWFMNHNLDFGYLFSKCVSEFSLLTARGISKGYQARRCSLNNATYFKQHFQM